MSEWISLQENRPAYGQECVFTDGIQCLYGWNNDPINDPDDPEFTFYILPDAIEGIIPTHWILIPKPPEREFPRN